MTQPQPSTEPASAPPIPLQQIRWLVGEQHVGSTDDEITSLIDARTTSWPEPARAAARTAALEAHHANQLLCVRFAL